METSSNYTSKDIGKWQSTSLGMTKTNKTVDKEKKKMKRTKWKNQSKLDE